MGFLVEESHVVVEIIVVESLFFKIKIQKCYRVDAFQAEVPVGPLLGLFAYGEGGVEERSVLEMLLVGILHLHDELLSLLVFAVHVEDGLAFSIHIADMLVVQVFHVLDDLETFKQRVEEIDEQVLVGLCSENALEAEVGQQADVAFLCVSHVLIYKMCAYAMAKVHCFLHTCKFRERRVSP